MKIVSINYQPILNDRCGNALIQKIFDSFKGLNPDKALFLTSSIDKDYGECIKGLNWSCYFIVRVFRKFCKILKIPYYYQRTIEEHIVDRYTAAALARIAKPYILLTSMYSPISCKLAKSKGNKVIFVAGNLNDNLYYNAIKAEKKRLGLAYTDVYDSDFRLDYYNRTLLYIDEVWCNSALCIESFRGTHNTKLVPTTFYTFKESQKKVYSETVKETIIFGYIGHTVLLKGIHQFAEAISKSKYKNKIKLEIAGSIAPEIRKIISKFNINVQYLGRISNEEKKKFMLDIDALVVPSLFDCGPTTIYEGLETSTPLIVSDGCGAAEFLTDGKNCVLFEHSNLENLTNKINYFCENYKELTKRAIETNSETIESIIRNNPDDAFTKAITELTFE